MTKYKAKNVFVLPVLLLSSVVANAATDLDAVEACSDAIATTFANKQDAAVKVRIDQAMVDAKHRLGRLTKFHLDVFEASTTSVVGRFDCTVNRGAKIRSLVSLSIDAPSAEERSRS